MRHADLIELIEKIFPEELTEEWDNSGLQIGPFDRDVRRVGIALNPSSRSLESSIERNCDFLITHHPLFFSPLRRLSLSSPVGKTVSIAVWNQITVYAIHTPWDSAEGGGNDFWADLLGIKDRSPIVPSSINSRAGMGRIGEIERVPFEEVIRLLKKHVRFLIPVFAGKKYVSRVAVCTGSGGDLVDKVCKLKADLFITADLKYHQILEAVDLGLNLAIMSHHEMEEKTLYRLASVIGKAVPEISVEVLKERDPLSG